jgi:hypothetical protein
LFDGSVDSRETENDKSNTKYRLPQIRGALIHNTDSNSISEKDD